MPKEQKIMIESNEKTTSVSLEASKEIKWNKLKEKIEHDLYVKSKFRVYWNQLKEDYRNWIDDNGFLEAFVHLFVSSIMCPILFVGWILGFMLIPIICVFRTMWGIHRAKQWLKKDKENEKK